MKLGLKNLAAAYNLQFFGFLLEQGKSGKSVTPSQTDQSCWDKSGKPIQPDQSCRGKLGKPSSLINFAQENQAIRQMKKKKIWKYNTPSPPITFGA